MNCSEAKLSACDACERRRNEAGPRSNKTLFKSMLKEIRRREDMFNDGSQVAFVIRVRPSPALVRRGVATAGDTGDASPVRPTMSPYIKMTTGSLSSELTFDE